jgi:tRNA pseudouridine13 synthase
MALPQWPYATGDRPPLPATIKTRDEDFVVDEVPAYEPSGEGDHTYIRIEKQGLTTMRAVRDLARALGVKPRDVGYAGIKDAHGVTRQTLSIEHCDPDRVRALDLPRMTILGVDRHRNKLRTGHLKGNRFTLRLRNTEPERIDEVREALTTLEQHGAPNYYGPQRFGERGDNWEVGRALLLGDREAAAGLIWGSPPPDSFEDRLERMDRRMLGLYVSAFQSYLFNEVVASRVDALGVLVDGDLAWKHENGAVFRVDESAVEQPRADRFEISPTGPMFGHKMTRPTARAAELEDGLLEREGMALSDLPRSGPLKCIGGRRPLRLKLNDGAAEAGNDEHGPFIELRFTLPPGGYATTLLREICQDGLRGA